MGVFDCDMPRPTIALLSCFSRELTEVLRNGAHSVDPGHRAEVSEFLAKQCKVITGIGPVADRQNWQEIPHCTLLPPISPSQFYYRRTNFPDRLFLRRTAMSL